MQNRYTGDIGDFGKYAFLKAVVGQELRLGVVWYLNTEQEANTDGNRVKYEHLRPCDPALHDALAELRQSKRCVQSVESMGILPAKTLYYSEPLPSGHGVRVGRTIRSNLRAAWHSGAMKTVRNADLVFVDPDNGLAGAGLRAGEARANKYVLLEELAGYLNGGHSLVIYHHQTREKGGITTQIDQRLRSLLQLPAAADCWTVLFRRQSVRAFIVVAHAKHAYMLRARSEQFQHTGWCRYKHFELYAPTWRSIRVDDRSAELPPAL